MSIFDTDILESKTVIYKNREFKVYEMSAYDRIHKIKIPDDSDDPIQRQKNNYQITESMLFLALKPGYPDKSDEEINQALKKMPNELLDELWKAAAELNKIPIPDIPEKNNNKKK